MKTNLIQSVLLSCGTFIAGSLAVSAADVKPAAKPQVQPAAKKTAAIFDAKNQTFKFGTKELQFANNGTFKVISSGRCISTGSFFMSTDFQASQSNAYVTKLTPGAYKGGPLYVETCKVDEKANSITVEGKLPFHKKGTPVQLGSWKQIAKLTPDGKVDITLDFVLPKGQAIGRTQGFTLLFPTATGYTYGQKSEMAKFSKDQKALCLFTGPAIKPVYPNKADSCSWEFPEKQINYLFFHRNNEHGIFFVPHGGQTNFCHVVFNPL